MSGIGSKLDFALMRFCYKFRDLIRPRADILEEVGLKEGFHVLDYGCGTGSYIPGTAKLVGRSGKLFTLDINPLAVEKAQEIACKHGLHNVVTIQSDCRTGLVNGSIDAVLLYDIFHDLTNQTDVLEELHHILKPGGVLSFSDHHLSEAGIISGVAQGGFFELAGKGEKTYTFRKRQPVSE